MIMGNICFRKQKHDGFIELDAKHDLQQSFIIEYETHSMHERMQQVDNILSDAESQKPGLKSEDDLQQSFIVEYETSSMHERMQQVDNILRDAESQMYVDAKKGPR